MEKKVLEKKETIDNKKENKKTKLTPKQKEIIITVVVLIFSVIVGFIIGKYLFEAMYGRI